MGARREGPRGRPGIRRRAALWYVLASSYALACLLANRFVSGEWELDGRFVANLVGVTLVQLAVLELVLWRCAAGESRGLPPEDGPPEPPP